MHVAQTRSILLKGGFELAEQGRISIICDKELKEGAEEVFKIIGISTNAAVKLFLQAVVREQAIPFRLDARTVSDNERMM